MSKLYTTESGHSMPNLAEGLTTFRRALKSLPLPATARLARGFGKALPAVVFAVIAIACGSDSGTSAAEPDSARNPPVQMFSFLASTTGIAGYSRWVGCCSRRHGWTTSGCICRTWQATSVC